jgi:hypothetical protein
VTAFAHHILQTHSGSLASALLFRFVLLFFECMPKGSPRTRAASSGLTWLPCTARPYQSSRRMSPSPVGEMGGTMARFLLSSCTREGSKLRTRLTGLEPLFLLALPLSFSLLACACVGWLFLLPPPPSATRCVRWASWAASVRAPSVAGATPLPDFIFTIKRDIFLSDLLFFSPSIASSSPR